jgi:hypothetical protein
MADQKSIQEQEKAILRSITVYPNGLTIHQIKDQIGWKAEIRQLQRRLEKLLKNGDINRSGYTRAIRYLPVIKPSLLQEPEFESRNHTITLSETATKLIQEISKQQALRNPVGYHRDFLESYRPNKDYYLSEAEREKLANMGRILEIDSNKAGTFAKKILEKLLIDLSWNSSRLEGNSYSLLETERLLKEGINAEGKLSIEARMILNHKNAIEFMVFAAEEISYDRSTILNLHSLLSENLMAEETSSGRLRIIPVGIRKSVYQPLNQPQLLEEMFTLMLEKARAIQNPFEQAFFIMVQLPYLQPFEDVNKRVSRVATNIAFNQHNLSPLSFVDVPHDLYIKGLIAVYELNRVELLKDIFIWAYDRSSASYAALRRVIGDPDPFYVKYQSQIKAMINTIITELFTKERAIRHIHVHSASIPEQDRAKFIEEVESALLGMHEGNFAKFYVRPSQYKAWVEVWR